MLFIKYIISFPFYLAHFYLAAEYLDNGSMLWILSQHIFIAKLSNKYLCLMLQDTRNIWFLLIKEIEDFELGVNNILLKF